MRNSNVQCKPVSIAKTRWVSYAAAGAATALAGSQSAEAAIHYSGPVNEPIKRGAADFLLDQFDDSFRIWRHFTYYGFYGKHHGHHHRREVVEFAIFGNASVGVRGGQGYVSQLGAGQEISAGNFIQGVPDSYSIFPQNGGGNIVLVAGGNLPAQGGQGGISFIGFRFNNGAGIQYGWARINIKEGGRSKTFTLVDYAYADPGERLMTGQTSEGILSAEEGSLGGLALGAVGLLAWRRSRKSLTAR